MRDEHVMGDAERWRGMLAELRERAYRTLDADPQTLLDGDGGPEGRTADIVSARLVSADDAVVDDVLLERVAPVFYRAVMPRLTLASDPATLPTPTLLRATYVLQRGYATLELAPESGAPLSLWPAGDGFRNLRLLFVRYRHRF